MLVPAEFFTPPPKVDSQVVVLKRRDNSLVNEAELPGFFRLVKAGFSAKRKKLRSSLAGGLRLDKKTIELFLDEANISADARAEDLSIDQWLSLTQIVEGKTDL